MLYFIILSLTFVCPNFFYCLFIYQYPRLTWAQTGVSITNRLEHMEDIKNSFIPKHYDTKGTLNLASNDSTSAIYSQYSLVICLMVTAQGRKECRNVSLYARYSWIIFSLLRRVLACNTGVIWRDWSMLIDHYIAHTKTSTSFPCTRFEAFQDQKN